MYEADRGKRPNRKGRAARLIAAAAGAVVLATGAGAWHYRESPRRLAEDVVRFGGSAITGVLYARDLDIVRAHVDAYAVGPGAAPLPAPASWREATRRIPRLTLEEGNAVFVRLPATPFVYEDPDAPPLRRLREEYRLDELVAGAPDEYAAQLALGRWVGTRFGHRMDARPEGYPWFDPVTVLHAAEGGESYWCEVVARLTVYAATSLGWPARMVVISRVGGSRYDHAVAELWSNEFGKWFILDTDYNHVFEAEGRPLSSYEMCHDGPRLERAGGLRIRQFAPTKAGVDESRDQLPYFAYVHVDLRNDWLSRRLHRGSPAGGERSTLWTARPGSPDLLTLRQREDGRETFDWPVNTVEIRTLGSEERNDGTIAIRVGLSAYAPYFEAFALSVDGSEWEPLDDPVREVVLGVGSHEVAARALTRGGPGPPSRVRLEIRPLP